MHEHRQFRQRSRAVVGRPYRKTNCSSRTSGPIWATTRQARAAKIERKVRIDMSVGWEGGAIARDRSAVRSYRTAAGTTTRSDSAQPGDAGQRRRCRLEPCDRRRLSSNEVEAFLPRNHHLSSPTMGGGSTLPIKAFPELKISAAPSPPWSFPVTAPHDDGPTNVPFPSPAPPPFGPACRSLWALEDGYLNLNHGQLACSPSRRDLSPPRASATSDGRDSTLTRRSLSLSCHDRLIRFSSTLRPRTDARAIRSHRGQSRQARPVVP